MTPTARLFLTVGKASQVLSYSCFFPPAHGMLPALLLVINTLTQKLHLNQEAVAAKSTSSPVSLFLITFSMSIFCLTSFGGAASKAPRLHVSSPA